MSKPLTQGKAGEVDFAPSPAAESESKLSQSKKKTVCKDKAQGEGGYSSSLTASRQCEERKRPKRDPRAEKRVRMLKEIEGGKQVSASEADAVKEHGVRSLHDRTLHVEYVQQATNTQPDDIRRPEGGAGRPTQSRTRTGHYHDVKQERHHPPKLKRSHQPCPGHEQDREGCGNEHSRSRWRQQQHQRRRQAGQRGEGVSDNRTGSRHEANKLPEPHLKIHSSEAPERHSGPRSEKQSPPNPQPQREKESSSKLVGAVRHEGDGAPKDALATAMAEEGMMQPKTSQSGVRHSRESRTPVGKFQFKDGRRTGGRPPRDVGEEKCGSDGPSRQAHEQRRSRLKN